jgi:phosphatidylethanolamine-binding protein (PEBP) family uncharacterized protein
MPGKDAGGGGTGGGADAGAFTFSGDFAMMGNRLCFKNGNTGGTGQKSPALNWSNAPSGTMSYVVSLRDNTNQNVHWIACNIPASATGLPAGLPNAMLPAGAQQADAWYGPGAPDVHQYQYKLWAMKVPMVSCANLAQGARNTFWSNLTKDEMGAKAQVLETREIVAYGNTKAECM